MVSPTEPITLDLFCGAGGIAEGFRQAGFRCVFANDIDDDAVATFRQNHSHAQVASGSIASLDPDRIRRRLGLAKGEVDCLVAGPPCQGFSINAPIRSLDDPRNKLFAHYLRFVESLKPKTLLFENVPGMLSLGDGLVVKRLLRELMAMGYDVAQKILFAAHYGVPQERWRLIVLASRIGPAPRHPHPSRRATGRANFTGGRTLAYKLDARAASLLPSHVTVEEAIGDLPPLRPGEGADTMPYAGRPHSAYSRAMRDGSRVITHHVAPRIAAVNLQRLRHIRPGGSWRDIPFELLPAGMKKARSSDHTKRYGRLRPDGLASTVMTKMDPHWGSAFHYRQHRTLTVREAARLQSFPDRYLFVGSRVSQYAQVGNAVPVLMARAIAEEIAAALVVAESPSLVGGVRWR